MCRDCVHWKCEHIDWLENCPRETKPEDGWVDGDCLILRRGITINISHGGYADSVETDANFGCVYGETAEQTDKL